MRGWEIMEAVLLARRVEEALAPHYHVALGGSVLHAGESAKDLDLYVYPHQCDHYSIEEIHARLRSVGLTRVVHWHQVRADWRERGIADDKVVEVYRYTGGGPDARRVDVVHFNGRGDEPRRGVS